MRQSMSQQKKKANNNEKENKTYELFKKALEECSQDDEDLQLYVMALDECNSFDEMSTELGWNKKKNFIPCSRKMSRRVIKYLETKKKNW